MCICISIYPLSGEIDEERHLWAKSEEPAPFLCNTADLASAVMLLPLAMEVIRHNKVDFQRDKHFSQDHIAGYGMPCIGRNRPFPVLPALFADLSLAQGRIIEV